MSDPYASALGVSIAPKFGSISSYGTPSDVLDRLMHTESSGNPYAVNKQTKAMGPYQFTPETVADLQKRGIKFNPFDPQEARAAADWYLQDLKAKNGGDLNKAVASYGGFVKQDPSGYQSKVLGNQQPANDPYAAALGVSDNPATPKPAQPAEAANQQIGGGRGITPASAYWPQNNQHSQQAKQVSQPVRGPHDADPITAIAANQLTGLGSSIVGGWKGLATLASGGSMNDAANAVTQYQQEHTYQPEAGTLNEKAVNLFNSGYNPLTWVGRAGDIAGSKTAQALNYVGASPEVSGAAGAAVNTAINAAPYVLGWGARNKPLNSIIKIGPAEDAQATQAAAQRVEPTLQNEASPKPRYKLNTDGTFTRVDQPVSGSPQSSIAQPSMSVSEQANQTPAIKPVPENVAPASSVADKNARAATLQRVLGNNAVVRDSAVSGDMAAAKGDFELAKTAAADSPAGIHMNNTLNAERQGLQSYAQKLIDSTGGTSGMAEDVLDARGKTIAKPFDAYRDWFNQKIKSLYNAADERAGGAPSIDLSGFKSLLDTDSQFAGKAENGSLRNGIKAYLTEQNILNKDGSMNPITAQQAEGVRQYINSQYSHQTSGLAGKIIDSLDNDVVKGAGDDIYIQARSLFKQKKQTLDNPNGVAKMFDYDPSTPINRATPFPKIPEEISRLSPDQLQHITDTLRGMPDELQPQAQAALGEIKSHFANKLADAGNSTQSMWNAKGVTKFMNQNAEKLNRVFADDPQMLQQMQDLRDAGNYTAFDRSYVGADAQKLTLMNRGIVTAKRYLPNLVGNAVPVVGPVAGQMLGEKWARAAESKAALKAAQSRTVRLSDIVKPTDR